MKLFKTYKYDKKDKKYIENEGHFQNNTLNLKNDFVAQGRHILIHDGFSPKNSDGCLLINQNLTFKDKAQTIEVDNILQVGKKDRLAEHIKDKFKSYLFRTKNNQSIKDIMQQIEVGIENGVETTQLKRAEN